MEDDVEKMFLKEELCPNIDVFKVLKNLKLFIVCVRISIPLKNTSPPLSCQAHH